MTNNEFKAWFEGFSEGIEFAPTRAQWEKITAKIAQIDNVPLFPQIVYRDRYLPGYPYIYPYGNTYTTASGSIMNTSAAQSKSGESADDIYAVAAKHLYDPSRSTNVQDDNINYRDSLNKQGRLDFNETKGG